MGPSRFEDQGGPISGRQVLSVSVESAMEWSNDVFNDVFCTVSLRSTMRSLTITVQKKKKTPLAADPSIMSSETG